MATEKQKAIAMIEARTIRETSVCCVCGQKVLTFIRDASGGLFPAIVADYVCDTCWAQNRNQCRTLGA